MSGSNDRNYSVKVFGPCREVFGMTLKEFPQPLCASVFIIQVHLNVYIIDVKMLLHILVQAAPLPCHYIRQI